ncbi:unnamed protein product [Cuscuta europaea]|uniref:Uncharacterized protein n=1 Tax=Cuscuta europaea TaxID=41803 RepID=A0A9P0ZQX9_CUSEU|nr:unnamed protein product [Cuscuta europaea]
MKMQCMQIGRKFILCYFSFYYFSDFSVCFLFGVVVVFHGCKTLDLDVGDFGIGVTVYGLFVPINESASYIASGEVINSESGSRDSGCQDSICRITHNLNVGISI